ncbi:hypothetical protein AMAG_02554 [Allomyces macrogynus ATCC 38327]|uniref:SPX domain-containing protein n=1 Tax=Allomyces macrogynus (strain ATCC 38327) TaxID=578462 RepID=A0A0L0S2Z4_ALLM3|nr:hypothetical protein AMAG_02554 [Allomyces macrogynus ATCC 38327]|eukprot:KNE56780.1 hypothetical protein AMAG_02554 [Allomyces macrogynus ATCC 38327]
MKFGHQIETEMSALPPDYRPLVLSYKTLKKQLKGIVRELEARGVTPELLEALQRAVNPPAPGAPAPCLYSPEDLLAASEPRGPVSDEKPDDSAAASASTATATSPATTTPAATETESTATTTTAPAPVDTDSLRARSPSPVSSRTSSPGTTPGVEELTEPPLGCSPPSHETTAPVSLLSASLAATQLANAEAAPSNGAGATGLDRRVSVQTTASAGTTATTTTSTSFTSRTSSTMSSGPKISYVLEHPPIEEEVDEEVVEDEDAAVAGTAAPGSPMSRSPPGTSYLSSSPDSVASSPLSTTTTNSFVRRRSSAASQFDSYLVIQMDEETRQSCEPILQGTACEVTEDGAIKVRLASDAQFFAYLSSALHRVGDFQRDHVAKSLHTQLTNLVREMSELTRVECPDHATWRGIIRAYLESDMFLTMSYKPKSPQDAADTLFKFESTVARALAHPGFDFNVLSIQPGDEPAESPCAEDARKDGGKHSKRVWTSVRSMLPRLLFRPPVSGFRDKRSWAVYSHFLQLNHELLALQRFVELNSTAVRKILKKHDKKTRLPSQMLWQALDAAEHADPLHAAIARTDDLARIRRMVAASSDAGHEFTRALVTAVNQTLEGVTPQLATYTCPICADILYPPVRLPGCGHLLCYPCADRLVLDASVPKPADLPPGIPPTALALPPHRSV